MKSVLVSGGGGFIGAHLVKRLKEEGFWVRAIDLEAPEFCASAADEFAIGDMRDPRVAAKAVDGIDEIYQLAADMGGAGYLFTGENDAAVLHNSALININVAEAARRADIKRVFFASSACVYPQYNQTDPNDPKCAEDSVYPADPDSEYGWEKLFSERLYLSFGRNYGIEVRIGRFHNIFGPEGTWEGGKEKAPAALCRKVAEAVDGDEIEVWGDGKQTRSFLYVDECVEGVRRLMDSSFDQPLNIGAEEMVTVDDLARTIIQISGKRLGIRHIPGPEGVRGRNSDNTLIRRELGWAPSQPMRNGLEKTYCWIETQVKGREPSRRAS